MMGPRQVARGALFYEFSIEEFVPDDHPLRGIDRFLVLTEVRPTLAPYYSLHGRLSNDPELMIRMLLLGYCQAAQKSLQVLDRDAALRQRNQSFMTAVAQIGKARIKLRNCAAIYLGKSKGRQSHLAFPAGQQQNLQSLPMRRQFYFSETTGVSKM